MGYTPQSLPGRRLLDDLNSTGHVQQLRGYESMIAGASAGLISSIVTCPLDVIKTTLQAQGASVSVARTAQFVDDGIFATISKIWHGEGIRGFYRGLGPTIYGYLPTWGIYFTVYDRAKYHLSQSEAIDSGKEWTNHMLAAMIAGATGTICTNPLWVIKTRFMTQRVNDGQVRYKNTLDAVKRIYASEGIPGFYRGLVPSLFGVSHVAVQFPLYERFKALARKQPDEDLPATRILLCSSGSKMIASFTTYPHEVLRTRLQVQDAPPITTLPQGASLRTQFPPSASEKRGVLEILISIYKHEGVRGFYRGLTVNFLRTVPSNALTILTYEVAMRHLCRLSGSDSLTGR